MDAGLPQGLRARLLLRTGVAVLRERASFPAYDSRHAPAPAIMDQLGAGWHMMPVHGDNWLVHDGWRWLKHYRGSWVVRDASF